MLFHSKNITRRTKTGAWYWALQNKVDGHCIYDIIIHETEFGVQGVGISEKLKFGHGSAEASTDVYVSQQALFTNWGLK